MRVAAWCSFLLGSLQLYSAMNINCTVIDDNQTMYSISEVSRVSDAKALECEYSWTGFYVKMQVIAHHKWEMPVLVLRNSINTLVTSHCIDNIIFTRSCVAEGTEYMANCTVNCTLFHVRNSGLSQKEKETRSHMAAIVPVCLLVVVLMLLGFLCYKHKTCSQLGCLYTAVKADVEAGNE